MIIVQWLILLGTSWGFSNITYAHKVVILQSAQISAYSEAVDAFKSALPPSYHVSMELNLQGDMAKGQNLAGKIRASNADVVLAVGLKAAIVAKQEIVDRPVMFCLVLDPQKYGLPIRNMVGLSIEIPFREHVKPLRTLFPKIAHIGVLFDPQNTKGKRDRLQRDATTLGITIHSQEVQSEQDISKALNLLEGQIDALWLLPDSTVLTDNTLDFLISATLETNVPVVGFSAGLVQRGALVGAHVNYGDIGKQAAALIQDLLTHPPTSLLGTLVQPNRVYQSINRKSAEYLGLTPLPEVLRQFDGQY